MLSSKLFTKTVICKTVTPYKKLRDYYRLTPDYVADILGVSVSSLYKYERDGSYIPKEIILHMDKLYRCNGQLVQYWLENNPSSELFIGLNRIG